MRRAIVLFALVLVDSPIHAQTPTKAIADFNLKDIAGNVWSLSGVKDKKAVVAVFLGTQCPVNNAYLPRLTELAKQYEAKGVQFVAINANDHDSLQDIADHAKKHKLAFPVLRDESHVTTDKFGAQRT